MFPRPRRVCVHVLLLHVEPASAAAVERASVTDDDAVFTSTVSRDKFKLNLPDASSESRAPPVDRHEQHQSNV